MERFASAGAFHEALCAALGAAPEPSRRGRPVDRFVGRRRELRRIDEALAGARKGESRTLCFAGAGGVGKTRLLSEARTRAQLAGLRTVDVQFRGLADAPSPLIERLRALPAEERAWVEAMDPAYGGSAEGRAAQAAESFFADSGEPLVLVVDDLDCADRPSRRLVDAFLSCAAKRGTAQRALVLITASTSPPVPGERGEAMRVLPPLARGEAIELLRIELAGLDPPRLVLDRAAREAHRVPRDLARIASLLRDRWEARGVVPAGAEIPRLDETSGAAAALTKTRNDPECIAILELLSIARRPLLVGELQAGLGQQTAEACRRRLRRLARMEIVVGERRARARTYVMSSARLSEEIARRVPAARARRWHRRLLDHLDRQEPEGRGGARRWIAVARHAATCGRARRAREAAFHAAETARSEGVLEPALDLLRELREGQPGTRRAFGIAKLECSLLEETGDHSRGVQVLESFRARVGELTATERAHFWRALGVHLHRSGDANRAIECFDTCLRVARERRSLTDLILVDCELAEIRIYKGDYAGAEEACRRGLGRLDRVARGSGERDGSPGAAGIVLRASLGHLELRRMRRIPPLRERLEDVLPLAEHFLARHAAQLGVETPSLSKEAERALLSRGWPGNVREVEATVVGALVLHRGQKVLDAEHVAASAGDEAPGEPGGGLELFSESQLEGHSFEELRHGLERAFVLNTLRENQGDFEALKKGFGIGRTQLYDRLRKLGLDPRELRRRFERR